LPSCRLGLATVAAFWLAARRSVGIGIAIGQYSTGDGLLRDADLALYEAKAAGKNRYVIFEPPVDTVSSRSPAEPAPAAARGSRWPERL
jgi:predicted signal transduction protein with EAL and GGDEF domain